MGPSNPQLEPEPGSFQDSWLQAWARPAPLMNHSTPPTGFAIPVRKEPERLLLQTGAASASAGTKNLGSAFFL